MRILVLGVTGMLGHMLFAGLARKGLDVHGACRSQLPCRPDWKQRIHPGMDAGRFSTVTQRIDAVAPEVVINAVGLIRQIPEGQRHLPCLRINALFPWELGEYCQKKGIRLIHYSTDCVFDGKKGSPYLEDDEATAHDIYGQTKFLGEVRGENTLTIRTSIIGPELRGHHSLLDWFLAQKGHVQGYTDAIYSGLPTSEHARILCDHILPHPEIEGLYQISSSPISKYELLRLIARVYSKEIRIDPVGGIGEDKRLSGDAFRLASGYVAPDWPELVSGMHAAHEKNLSDFSPSFGN